MQLPGNTGSCHHVGVSPIQGVVMGSEESVAQEILAKLQASLEQALDVDGHHAGRR